MKRTKSNKKDTNEDLCPSCGKNPAAIEPHTCPFAEDVEDDHETLCQCCEECTHECAMDI